MRRIDLAGLAFRVTRDVFALAGAVALVVADRWGRFSDAARD